MKREYVDIFNLCFPKFQMSFERFCSLMKNAQNSYYEYTESGEILGFAIVDEFAIRLICVSPDRQRSGIGTMLLRDIEKDLKNKGFTQVITGGVSSHMFIGAVSESWSFFEKAGFLSVGLRRKN